MHGFNALYPGVRVDLRVKELGGPGGMLESLAAIEAVSTDALPDVVLLNRSMLESAALKELIVSLDEFSSPTEDTDWYDFAYQLSRIENQTFGMPFAADTLAMVFSTEQVSQPPIDWAMTTAGETPILFAAGERQALTTLALYQASGGRVVDEQNRPTIDEDILASTLTFISNGRASGVFSPLMLQYSSQTQVWDEFLQESRPMAITWLSNYLRTLPADTRATLIPTQTGEPYAPMDGWVWAISNRMPERQTLSIDLIRFLTASEFIAQWSEAAGYLPPRPSALEAWGEGTRQTLASRVVLAADVLPPLQILNALGPAMQRAVQDVLNQQARPTAAAETVAERLGQP
jgi:ABC-type glycerol-3-phosphate transport system substrate-binding protein